jgi:hypothetical protein
MSPVTTVVGGLLLTPPHVADSGMGESRATTHQDLDRPEKALAASLSSARVRIARPYVYFRLSPRSALQVFGPTLPSTSSLCLVWNRLT